MGLQEFVFKMGNVRDCFYVEEVAEQLDAFIFLFKSGSYN